MQFTSTERQSRPSAVESKGFMAAIESTYTTGIDPITKQRGGQTWLPCSTQASSVGLGFSQGLLGHCG